MKFFKELKLLLENKGKKRNVFLSVIVFLLIIVISFFAVFRCYGIIYLKQMDEYMEQIPKNLENHKNEFYKLSRVYEEDILARAELGLIIFKEQSGLTDAEKLEQLRSAVSADSISLLDEQGKVLSTTGPVTPEETFLACIQNLEAHQTHLEFFRALSNDEEKTQKSDGKGFVRIPISENTKQSLVFEFSCGMILDLYNSLADWSIVLNRMFFGTYTAAFIKSGDKLVLYPQGTVTGDDSQKLYEDLTKIFESNSQIWHTKKGLPVKLVTLLGNRYLASPMRFSFDDSQVLITIPMKTVIGNGIYISIAVTTIIVFGLVLIQIYIYRRLLEEKAKKGTDEFPRKMVFKVMLPGVLVMLIVTNLFSNMLLLLENRANAASIAESKRIAVQYEIEQNTSDEAAHRSTYVNYYLNRAKMLAAFLTEHPDYQTHASLADLSRTVKTDYLMRFDSSGQELIASNSYTGFSVGKNLSEEYEAVLMGYPYIVVGPSKDPYTSQMQLGAAILMTDADGQPDGFLLAVYNAGQLDAEIKWMSPENTVNRAVVPNGYFAAIINDNDGRFTAHTDPNMIGQKADDVLDNYESGSFEGFSDYKGKYMCVSASSDGEKTIMFMLAEHGTDYIRTNSLLIGFALLVGLVLLYYSVSDALIALVESKPRPDANNNMRAPILIFPDGYSVFLTLFAFFVMVAYFNNWWTSFNYVFQGNWSKGVHLFSIWAAMFVVAITLCISYLARTVLNYFEKRFSYQSKTIARLVKSLVSYSVVIFLFFRILDMFGVNTKALLASAGVVSIAVGMGAQSMASDLLAGFFMMLEGSVHVGDRVAVSNVTGNVTDMGIRTTKITDDDGNVTILTNSKVSPICNMSLKTQAKKEEESIKIRIPFFGDNNDDDETDDNGSDGNEE